MGHTPSKHDRIAFITCTSLAIAVVVGMWVWSVQAVVANGVAGAKQTFSTIAETAGDVKAQTTPDAETVATVRAGLKGLLTPPPVVEEPAETVETDPTVDGIAELMKVDIETGYGETTGN